MLVNKLPCLIAVQFISRGFCKVDPNPRFILEANSRFNKQLELPIGANEFSYQGSIKGLI